MKTLILCACLFGLAFQAEVHQRVARSLSSSDSDETGGFFPNLRQRFPVLSYDQLLQLLTALYSRTVPNPAPAPVPATPAAPSTAPNPAPTLAPVIAG